MFEEQLILLYLHLAMFYNTAVLLRDSVRAKACLLRSCNMHQVSSAFTLSLSGNATSGMKYEGKKRGWVKITRVVMQFDAIQST